MSDLAVGPSQDHRLLPEDAELLARLVAALHAQAAGESRNLATCMSSSEWRNVRRLKSPVKAVRPRIFYDLEKGPEAVAVRA